MAWLSSQLLSHYILSLKQFAVRSWDETGWDGRLSHLPEVWGEKGHKGRQGLCWVLHPQGRGGTSLLHQEGQEMLEIPAALPVFEAAVICQPCFAAVLGGRGAPCSSLSPGCLGRKGSANVLPWRL